MFSYIYTYSDNNVTHRVIVFNYIQVPGPDCNVCKYVEGGSSHTNTKQFLNTYRVLENSILILID